jgi:two-component system KDP operon response regulator KdpE
MSARVLVVDDEPQILRALRTSLHGAGYEVETAETAEGALAALAANPPDAVVLDLVLPDGSGTQVTRELRTWSSAPVIVLSVVGDEAEKVAALDAGADERCAAPTLPPSPSSRWATCGSTSRSERSRSPVSPFS